MVDHALLLADLKKQVRVLEEDLRERSISGRLMLGAQLLPMGPGGMSG